MTSLLLLCCLSLTATEPAVGAPGAVAAAVDAGVTALPEPELPRSELPLGVTGAEDLDVGWALVRTVVVLGLVLALVYLTLNVGLRRLLGIRPSANVGLVKVLERVTLDPKRSLFVVEAAGEVLLLGGSEASVTLISKLDPAEVARLKGAAEPGPGAVQVSPFLQKLLGRKVDPPSRDPVEKP